MSTYGQRIRRSIAGGLLTSLILGGGFVVQGAVATQPMTATSAVNVRSGPGTSYAVIGVLASGQRVEATGTVSGGWIQVSVSGRTGWVYRTFLVSAAPAPTASASTSPTASGTVTTTAAVNVRTGPGLTYTVVTLTPRGTTLPATGVTAPGWTQVLHQGSARWISSSYLTRDAASVAAPLPATTGQLRTTASVNVRAEGTLSGTLITTVAAGVVLDATSRTTAEYSEIIHQGRPGWVATRYTRPVAPVSPTTPATPVATGTGVVSVGVLNVRATDAADGPVVGEVYRGATLPTTGVRSGDWTQVIHQGVARWVFTSFVTPVGAVRAVGATSPIIPAGITTSGITQLNANAKAVVTRVISDFQAIRTIYGYRPSSAYSSDHPNGRAVDLMISDWSNPSRAEEGWEVARFFATNAKTYRVNYIIYRQSIFNAAYPERGWRPMEDRGDATANHFDHVHISVFDG